MGIIQSLAAAMLFNAQPTKAPACRVHLEHRAGAFGWAINEMQAQSSRSRETCERAAINYHRSRSARGTYSAHSL